MDIPSFSSWVPIAQRATIQNCGKRGLYIVGRFDACPTGPADPLDERVIYIGETHGLRMSIRRRLSYFARAAEDGLVKHSGGRRCFREFGPKLPDLHVAALPMNNPDQRQLEAKIFEIERHLIAVYAGEWSAIPLCNVSRGKCSEGDNTAPDCGYPMVLKLVGS